MKKIKILYVGPFHLPRRSALGWGGGQQSGRRINASGRERIMLGMALAFLGNKRLNMGKFDTL